MPPAVPVLWIVTLVIAYAAVPLLVVLLWRIAHASRKIERYTRATRRSSRGVAAHLEALPALDETERLLGGARDLGGDLALGAEALAGVLARRTGNAS